MLIMIMPWSLPVPSFHVTELPARSGIDPQMDPAVAAVQLGAPVVPNKLSVNCFAN